MKSLSLIVCLILAVGYLTPVQAVTDAELEALEKQIEQQEVDEKKKAEEEVKRKAEYKRKAKAEAEKKRLVELEKKQRQEELRLLKEERRKLEEARQIELDRKQQEKEKKEKYDLLIAEAEQAISNKDKELSISKYTEVLALIPGDTVANLGMKEAEKLMDKECYEILGEWTIEKNWEGYRGNMNIKVDGTLVMENHKGTWKCLGHEAHTYSFSVPHYQDKPIWEGSVLKEGGRCLTAAISGICWIRPGSKK